MNSIARLTSITLGIAFLCSCSSSGWKRSETRLIRNDGQVMRVLTVTDPKDSTILRKECEGLSAGQLKSRDYAMLRDKMIATVTSPDQDGVGIAGPQVGITRRIVAVQRFDRNGEPFIVYPNIKITAVRGEKESGREGCLSVPDRIGLVDRYQDIDISYTSTATFRDTTENVKGFAAVIFQHECDHLDGILYTDRIEEE